MQNNTITYIDLVAIGFPKATAKQIIRQSKLNMVQKGYVLYSNKKLGAVPINAVENVLGFRLCL